jgi:hypothetical protein
VNALRYDLNTTAGIEGSLDRGFGRGAWAFDAHADVWVIPGPRTDFGRLYFICHRGGWWDEIIVPAEAIQ